MKIGRGKTDITFLKKGYSMLGYGQIFNTAETVGTPLYSRAISFQSQEKTFVFVCTDLCFVTTGLKKKIMFELESAQGITFLKSEDVMITAQHTHSAPSGFSEYGMYNMPTPGYHPDIVAFLSKQIAASIAQSLNNSQEGELFLSRGLFSEEVPVGFNRAIEAYNRNPDVIKVSDAERHLAIDREMILLLCKNQNNESIASINWFGVHTTSLSNDNHALHFDNKGYACEYLEEHLEASNHIGIFAQSCCGDVSPKFKYNPKRSSIRGFYEGMFEDDDQSAAYNGRLQYLKAVELIDSIESDRTKASLKDMSHPTIDMVESRIDFSKIVIDEERSTTKACVGLAFLMGVKMDGPGAPLMVKILCHAVFPFIKWFDIISAVPKGKEHLNEVIRKYKIQGNKTIVMETADQKLLGTKNVSKLAVPGWLDEFVSTFKFYHKTGALHNISWTPQVLPLHMVRLKNILLVGIPFEVTTIAGKRIKKSLQNQFPEEEIILCPYTNAYAAYVTTPEEYDEQMYEGGHCYFGRWTLDALILKLNELALELKKSKQERNPQVDMEPIITDEHLSKWKSFETKWWKKRKLEILDK